jgi:hypothetical protein
MSPVGSSFFVQAGFFSGLLGTAQNCARKCRGTVCQCSRKRFLASGGTFLSGPGRYQHRCTVRHAPAKADPLMVSNDQRRFRPRA